MISASTNNYDSVLPCDLRLFTRAKLFTYFYINGCDCDDTWFLLYMQGVRYSISGIWTFSVDYLPVLNLWNLQNSSTSTLQGLVSIKTGLYSLMVAKCPYVSIEWGVSAIWPDFVFVRSCLLFIVTIVWGITLVFSPKCESSPASSVLLLRNTIFWCFVACFPNWCLRPQALLWKASRI